MKSGNVTLTPENNPEFFAKLRAAKLQRQEARATGIPALKRLMVVAKRNTGQSGVVASFLLGLYNGYRFPFDMTDFRRLDIALFDDCMLVLKMDRAPAQDVHCYFEDGGKVFEALARNWGKTKPK